MLKRSMPGNHSVIGVFNCYSIRKTRTTKLCEKCRCTVWMCRQKAINLVQGIGTQGAKPLHEDINFYCFECE